jgi:hypothetical protein
MLLAMNLDATQWQACVDESQQLELLIGILAIVLTLVLFILAPYLAKWLFAVCVR